MELNNGNVRITKLMRAYSYALTKVVGALDYTTIDERKFIIAMYQANVCGFCHPFELTQRRMREINKIWAKLSCYYDINHDIDRAFEIDEKYAPYV